LRKTIALMGLIALVGSMLVVPATVVGAPPTHPPYKILAFTTKADEKGPGVAALKDIANASDNNQPYNDEELQDIVSPILGRAYESGIRLNGE